MTLRSTGGAYGCIEPPFNVFMNKTRKYPIKGVPDDIHGVAY